MSEPVTQKTLVAKLAEVMALVGNVPKKGRNKVQNYDFVRETDALDAVRPLLAERKIILTLNTVGHEFRPLYRTSSGNEMNLTILTIEGTWHDGESGETLSAGSWVGYGADTGDKSANKSTTVAVKYLLLKSFLIGTGDDPEADEKVDRAEQALGATARGSARVTGSSQPGVQRGGRSGIATQAQITAIGTAARELGFHVPDLRAYIESVLKVPVPEEPEKIKGFMAELTSGQAGQLVAGLRELLASDVRATTDADGNAPEAEPVTETTEPDDFALA